MNEKAIYLSFLHNCIELCVKVSYKLKVSEYKLKCQNSDKQFRQSEGFFVLLFQNNHVPQIKLLVSKINFVRKVGLNSHRS